MEVGEREGGTDRERRSGVRLRLKVFYLVLVSFNVEEKACLFSSGCVLGLIGVRGTWVSNTTITAIKNTTDW